MSENTLKNAAHQCNPNSLDCKKNHDVPNNSRYHFAGIKNMGANKTKNFFKDNLN